MGFREKLVVGSILAGGATWLIVDNMHSREAAFGLAVHDQMEALAYGNPVDASNLKTEEATSITAAIEKTLDGMGSNINNTGRAAGAACLIGAMNGADVKGGVELYRQALAEEKPDLLPTALRSCEDALVYAGVKTLTLPVGLLETPSTAP